MCSSQRRSAALVEVNACLAASAVCSSIGSCVLIQAGFTEINRKNAFQQWVMNKNMINEPSLSEWLSRLFGAVLTML